VTSTHTEVQKPYNDDIFLMMTVVT